MKAIRDSVQVSHKVGNKYFGYNTWPFYHNRLIITISFVDTKKNCHRYVFVIKPKKSKIYLSEYHVWSESQAAIKCFFCTKNNPSYSGFVSASNSSTVLLSGKSVIKNMPVLVIEYLLSEWYRQGFESRLTGIKPIKSR